MKKYLFVYSLIFSFSLTQGLSGLMENAKDGLKGLEKDIRDTYSLLELETDSNFENNSIKLDMVKSTLVAPDRNLILEEVNEQKKLLWLFPYNNMRFIPISEDNTPIDGKYSYVNFAKIGDVEVNNLSQGYFKEVKTKSNFWTSVVSRDFSFEVEEDNNTTLCECTIEASRKVIYPFLFKNRMMFLFWKSGSHPIRDLTQNLTNTLTCEISNSTEKYTLKMDYNEYKVKTKVSLAQRVIRQLLPEKWRDDGTRFGLKGTIKNQDKTYTISTNYDYDLSVLSDKSPFRVLAPPTGYVVKDDNNEFALVKNPSHFKEGENYVNDKDKGVLYSSIFAAYFYQPLGGKGYNGVYKSNSNAVNHYSENYTAQTNQTVSYITHTSKGEKRAKMIQDNRDRLNSMLKTQAKANQLFGDSRAQNSLVPGWENEREYLDLFYNASSRGPLGLY